MLNNNRYWGSNFAETGQDIKGLMMAAICTYASACRGVSHYIADLIFAKGRRCWKVYFSANFYIIIYNVFWFFYEKNDHILFL